MADCVQTPSLTRTDVTTSESLFPTSSVLTSTLPGSVSTSFFRTCTRTNTSIPCEATLTSSLVTLPGNTTILTVPVTGTIDVPITNIVTLFGSSCSVSISTPPPDTPTTSSTPILTTSTPPPSIVTSSSILTTDGSTLVTVFTSMTTPPPTVVDTSSTGTSLQSSTPSSFSFTVSTSSSSSFIVPTFSSSSFAFSLSSSSTTVPTRSSSSFTSTPTTSAAVVVVQTTGTSLPNNGVHHNDKKANNTGPIVGGVVGGLAALLLLGLLTWKLIKKQSGFDNAFNQDHKHHNKKDPEPKPYNYGLVGQNTNPTGLEPHGSPPTGHSNLGNDVGNQGGQTSNDTGYQGGQTGNDVGYQGGQDVGYQGGQGGNDIGYQGGHAIANAPNAPNQPPLQHLRNPSLTPLLAGVGVAAAAATANATTSSRPSSSRPSSSSSSQPSGPLVTNAPQGQGYPPPVPSSSYPPALQNWSNTQGYAPMNTPGGFQNPATTNAQGYGSGPSMAGPSTGLTHTGSITSIGSAPSTYSTSSWVGPSGSGGSGGVFNPAVPGIVPVVAAAGMRNNKQKAPQQPQQYDDPFARSGSPVSIQEQRILQVTNGEPSSPGGAAVYDPNVYYSGQTETSSSYSGAAGPSAASGSQAGSSSGVIDGKGRPLNFRGEKAPLVHLDGGLFEEPGPDAPRPQVGPAPPAYTD